jgi:hypothetical protein
MQLMYSRPALAPDRNVSPLGVTMPNVKNRTLSSPESGPLVLVAKLQVTRAGSTGRCNTISEFTCWSLKAQSFSRALIETQGYLVEMGLRVDGQVGLREVLS